MANTNSKALTSKAIQKTRFSKRKNQRSVFEMGF